MTILEAMQKTIDEAKVTDGLMRLYKRQSGYFVSREYWSDWLFQAYPGGRKILSAEGKNLVQKTHCLCGREWSDMGYCFYCSKFKPPSL